MKLFKDIGIIILVIGSLYFSLWWMQYKYKDCMKVGHSHLYCVMRLFGD